MSLDGGYIIKLAPHEDETFKQALPKTVQFIDDQLGP